MRSDARVVSLWNTRGRESVQEMEKAGRDVPSPTDKGWVPWPGRESSRLSLRAGAPRGLFEEGLHPQLTGEDAES